MGCSRLLCGTVEVKGASVRSGSDPRAPSGSPRRRREPSLHAARRRRRRCHDAGGDLIVLRPGHPCLRGSGSPRRSRPSGCACRYPRPVCRGCRARRASSRTTFRACRHWACSRERPARRCAGAGGLASRPRVRGERVRCPRAAVAVAEDGDEAPEALPRPRRAAGPGSRTARQVGIDTAMETTAGPVIRCSVRRARALVRDRGGRSPSGGRPSGRGELRSASNA